MRKLANVSAIMLTLALLLSTSGAQAAPLSGTIQGRVANGSGDGISGVTIYITNSLQATTDSNGNYSRSGVPAGGGYNVVAFAPSGYANAHQYNVSVTEGGTTTKNFTLISSVATLTGYIYDANTNARISGANLLVDSDVHDGWSNTANPSDGNGNYTLTNIAAGRSYYLHVFPPTPYSGVIIPVTINAGGNVQNVGLGASSGGVHGHVGLAGGGNAANTSIYIAPSTGGSGNSCSTNTDGSGNYSCSLTSGSYDVHAFNYSNYSGIVYYAQAVGSSYITVNFTLNNGPLIISGAVRDYNLAPLNGANAQAFENSQPGHFRTAFVGSDGAFYFPGLGNSGSPYTISASNVGYAPVTYSLVYPPSNNWNVNFKLGHFADVPGTDANVRIEYPFFYVEFLREAGVVSGFSDGTFRPTTSVKRGEYAKLLVTAAGWPIDTSGGPHFYDVATNYAFYGHIETAYHHGAITGYSDGSFRPNSTVSRAEATKISVAVSGWTLLNPGTPSYNDVATNHWAYRYIETAHTHGANAGDDAGYFRPNAAGTRAETAKLVCVANTSGCQ